MQYKKNNKVWKKVNLRNVYGLSKIVFYLQVAREEFIRKFAHLQKNRYKHLIFESKITCSPYLVPTNLYKFTNFSFNENEMNFETELLKTFTIFSS